MVHTQNIENTWMRAKRTLKRQFGTSGAPFHTCLDEFMWRCSFESKNYFGQLVLILVLPILVFDNVYYRYFQPFLSTISISQLFSLLNALLMMISFICLSYLFHIVVILKEPCPPCKQYGRPRMRSK